MIQSTPDPAILEALLAYWAKGVKEVSTQALGMTAYGHILGPAVGPAIAARVKGASWKKTGGLDGWIVLTEEPAWTKTG